MYRILRQRSPRSAARAVEATSGEESLDAACSAFTRGQVKTAGNILCSALAHLEALSGKNLDAGEAQEIRDCIGLVAGGNGVDLDCR